LSEWLVEHSPQATARTQFALAAAMWTIVGTVLPLVGFVWVSQAVGRAQAIAIILPLMMLGGLKAILILDKVAIKAAARIEARGERSCAFGFFSARAWAVVGLMMIMGQVLRAAHVPRVDIGFLYIIVGTGLLLASRIMWIRFARGARTAAV
jgi:hypothetical protein